MATKRYRFNGKALSIAQPWAWAVAYAGKCIENRSWRTHYRGPLAIHASATLFRADLDLRVKVTRGGERRPLIDWINRGMRRYGLETKNEVVQSAVVAIAMIVDCVPSSSSPLFRGEWGWVLEGIVPIEPVSMVGAQSIWPCRFAYTPINSARRRIAI